VVANHALLRSALNGPFDERQIITKSIESNHDVLFRSPFEKAVALSKMQSTAKGAFTLVSMQESDKAAGNFLNCPFRLPIVKTTIMEGAPICSEWQHTSDAKHTK
jgi:hypothetical protein